MKEASFYTAENGSVKCSLCPHNCIIKENKSGICRVRTNIKGKLYSENYAKICSVNSDPIEKKPLYHFHPGQNIFSVGSIGCNLHCKFCQNWEISQSGVKEFIHLKSVEPWQLVEMAEDHSGNIGIAYTYNEPTVWFELMLEMSILANGKGLKNVMVTNGFINPDPLAQLIEYMDAFSVDLKAFTDDFYKDITSSRLNPVLDSLKIIKESGKHLEITNLVIPNQNDDEGKFKEMVSWIAKELGPETVLHISRYYPTYKLNEPATSETKLKQLYKIARSKLQYVYIGNLRTIEGQNTVCPDCKTTVINRNGYSTKLTQLDKRGRCSQCNGGIISEGYL